MAKTIFDPSFFDPSLSSTQLQSLFIFGLMISIILSSCTTGAAVHQSQSPIIRFGAVFPLTGSTANQGLAARLGMELAAEDINSKGGIDGRNLSIIIEDGANNKAVATTASKKLVEIDKVNALFAVTTPMAGAIAPTAEESKIPFIYGSAAVSFALNKSFVFKDYADASDTCSILVNKALSSGHQKIALIGTDSEFTYLCRDGAQKSVKLSDFETYAVGDADFRTQVTKIKDSGASAVLVFAFSADCPNIFKQMQELNLSAQLMLPFQSFACGSNENTNAFPDILNGSWGSDVSVDESSSDPRLQAMLSRIKAKGGSTHLKTTLVVYDSVTAMAKAYGGCQDTVCAAGNLRKTDLEGVSGKISYQGGQIANRSIILTSFDGDIWRTG